MRYGSPTTQARGITQRELFARSDRRVVQEIVQEQIKVIDAAITTAHTAGFNHIEHELPVNFGINNLDKADSQTMVYSEILMIYKNPEDRGGKGFEDVYIDISNKPVLHVSWLNGMDDEERKRRKEFIFSCTMNRRSRRPVKK